MRLVFTLLLLFMPLRPLFAQTQGDIVIDLAQDRIGITSGFTGERVTLFGVTEGKGDIAVVLRGPDSRIVMRRKQPSLGLWLNRESVDFRHVPLFYAFALTAAESDLSDRKTLRRYGIGLNALQFDAADYHDDTNVPAFHEAMIRRMQVEGMFPLSPQPVLYVGQRLFKVNFDLPANVPVGRYIVDAYLFQNRKIVAMRSVTLDVLQAGISADILNFAVDYPLFYALGALSFAAAAGLFAFWMSRGLRV